MTDSLHRNFATMTTNTVEVQDEEGLRLYLDLFGSARAFWTLEDQATSVMVTIADDTSEDGALDWPHPAWVFDDDAVWLAFSRHIGPERTREILKRHERDVEEVDGVFTFHTDLDLEFDMIEMARFLKPHQTLTAKAIMGEVHLDEETGFSDTHIEGTVMQVDVDSLKIIRISLSDVEDVMGRSLSADAAIETALQGAQEGIAGPKS